jgi:hypothetical protein
MKTLKLVTIILFVVGTTFLVAETLPINGSILFNSYDKDNNGIITLKEFELIKTERIRKKIEEGRLMTNNSNSPSFCDLDINNDGKITKKELISHQQLNFNQRNTNINRGKGTSGKGQSRNC